MNYMQVRASFVIDELISQGSGYTKQVSVRFDGLCRYEIKYSRHKENRKII
jgi:hypothetical protein